MVCQIGYVEPVLFLYVFSMSYHGFVKQQFLYHKVCLGHYNETFCSSMSSSSKGNSTEENFIQEETASWDMYNSLARTIPAFVSTIYLGGVSDGVGRKKVLIFSLFGEGVKIICYFINVWYLSVPICYLLIGNLVSGICGGFGAIFLVTFAYISDVTTLQQRTKRIVLLDALIVIAGPVSEASGGVVIERYGFVTVYWIVFGIFGLLMTYVVFLKESYHPEETLKLREILMQSKIKEFIFLFTKRRGQYYRIKLFLMTFNFFAVVCLFDGAADVLVLYMLHEPLNFKPTTIGYLGAEGDVVKFVGACFVVLVLMKKFKLHDYSIFLLTCISFCGYTLCIGFSRKQWQMYASYIWGLGLLAGMSAARSRFTKMVTPEEQGKINSVIAITQLLAAFVGGIAWNSIYKSTVSFSPGFTFYILAGLSIFPILSTILLIMYERKAGNYQLQVNEKDEEEVIQPEDGRSSIDS